MKVIHILHELKFSGAEIMYVDAAPLFQQKGCKLIVLATAPELGEYAPYFEQAGYKVLHQPYPPLKNYLKRLKYYWNFSRFLKSEKIDVVHIHSHKCMWGMALAARIAKRRSVYTFHNVFFSRNIIYIYRCLLRWSAKKIFKCKFQTISDSVYEHELKFYHNPTAKIYNWYGSNRFFPALDGEKEKVRQELNIPPKTLVLISIGGCSTIKRHSEIIKALSLIISKTPNCIYLHLGKGISECEEQKLSLELGLKEHIRFAGNQKNVRKYLIASDIYLMTSIYEGISITTIEAMACNIPAILYNVPGLRDFNKTKECSILIEEDFTRLAESIIYLYKNKEKQKELISNAKQLVDSTFNMEINASKIFELYHQ
ncbi:MAG: glycosyltransferase family 4 protein [Bacteroidales bacterium]|jgi:glycosyltransferase involved in cell wall biosynthesis|nr:glycosyltransferase family 4 protein [Bacteroidales bacterium]